MEPEDSLQYSKELATDFYPEPDESSPNNNRQEEAPCLLLPLSHIRKFHLATSICWPFNVRGQIQNSYKTTVKLKFRMFYSHRLCGLVVRVPGYRSRGPGLDSRRYQIFWELVDLEWGPLSVVSITEELLQWKSSGSGSRKPRLMAMGIRCADHATPSIRKIWHKLRRQAAVARTV
jgi:hypothetical protein